MSASETKSAGELHKASSALEVKDRVQSDPVESTPTAFPSATVPDEDAPDSAGPSAAPPKDDKSANTVYFTIDDVVDAGGYGRFQRFLTLLAGMGWLADAFEIIILSVLGDFVTCQWTLHRWQNALMSSIVFFGMTLGAPSFGLIADRYGRKTSLGISMLFLFLFGAASAFAPSYIWIVVLRGIMGFALGGIAQGVTLCCEYYPAYARGTAGFYLSYYWAVGSLCVVLSAWLIMRVFDNWRAFLFVGAVPALLVFSVIRWYPESARYYLVSNQPDKATAILQRLMRMNRKKMPEGVLVEVDAKSQRGKIADLFKPAIRRSTLLFWYIWWAVAMTYYGIALTTPNIIAHGSLIESSKLVQNKSVMDDFMEEIPCHKYTDMQFFDLLWASAAEFPGILFFSIAVGYCDRKVLLGMSCLFVAFLTLFLQLHITPGIALLIVLFLDRAIITGIFQLLFIMTTEAFPTTLRASAMGTGSGCARIAGVIVPFLAQVLIISRPVAAIFFLSSVIGLAGIAAFLLPLETRGVHMQECIAT